MISDETRRSLQRRIADGKLAAQELRYLTARLLIESGQAKLIVEQDGFLVFAVPDSDAFKIAEPPGSKIDEQRYKRLKKATRRPMPAFEVGEMYETSPHMADLGQHRIIRPLRIRARPFKPDDDWL